MFRTAGHPGEIDQRHTFSVCFPIRHLMPTDIQRDILVVGAGAAGMYAAIAAARQGASVLLVDKSLIGRGGATVMAQMTVAAAIGEQAPDHWSKHLEDTLALDGDCVTIH